MDFTKNTVRTSVTSINLTEEMINELIVLGTDLVGYNEDQLNDLKSHLITLSHYNMFYGFVRFYNFDVNGIHTLSMIMEYSKLLPVETCQKIDELNSLVESFGNMEGNEYIKVVN